MSNDQQKKIRSSYFGVGGGGGVYAHTENQSFTAWKTKLTRAEFPNNINCYMMKMSSSLQMCISVMSTFSRFALTEKK